VLNFIDEVTNYEKETASIEIQKNIKSMLNKLIGKDPNNLNHFLIPAIIDKRNFNIDGKNYKIIVKMVIITQKILIYADIKTSEASSASPEF
jgi:hypothetical protein